MESTVETEKTFFEGWLKLSEYQADAEKKDEVAREIEHLSSRGCH